MAIGTGSHQQRHMVTCPVSDPSCHAGPGDEHVWRSGLAVKKNTGHHDTKAIFSLLVAQRVTRDFRPDIGDLHDCHSYEGIGPWGFGHTWVRPLEWNR
jgi:hypothetical protein